MLLNLLILQPVVWSKFHFYMYFNRFYQFQNGSKKCIRRKIKNTNGWESETNTSWICYLAHEVVTCRQLSNAMFVPRRKYIVPLCTLARVCELGCEVLVSLPRPLYFFLIDFYLLLVAAVPFWIMSLGWEKRKLVWGVSFTFPSTCILGSIGTMFSGSIDTSFLVHIS